MADQLVEKRICFVDCGKPAPECKCKPTVIGLDISNGVETRVEGFWENGVVNITDIYDVINRTPEDAGT